MNDQLRRIVSELDAATARLHRLTDGLTEDVWATKPARDAWSAAECVEHLNLTGRAFIPRLEQAIESAAGRDASAPYRMDFVGWGIGLASGPMKRIGRWRVGRIRTTAPFLPQSAPALAAAMAAFDQLQDEVRTLVHKADGRAIDRVRVTSPFDARISYSAYAALAVIPRHERRHIEQAEDSVSSAQRRGRAHA